METELSPVTSLFTRKAEATFKRVLPFYYRSRYVIGLLALMVLYFGGLALNDFLRTSTLAFQGKATEAAVAMKVLDQYFPQLARPDVLVLLISGLNLLPPPLDFDGDVQHPKVLKIQREEIPLLKQVSDALISGMAVATGDVPLIGYYTLPFIDFSRSPRSLETLRTHLFTEKDGVQSSFILFKSVGEPNTTRGSQLIDLCQSVSQTYGVQIQAVSNEVQMTETLNSLWSDLHRLEFVSAPLGIFIIYMVFRSVPFVILSAVTLVLSLCFASLVNWIIVRYITHYLTSADFPLITTSCATASCLDYCLFFLNSLYENQMEAQETQESNDAPPALNCLPDKQALRLVDGNLELERVLLSTATASAHSITTSGICLAVCLGSSLWLPIEYLKVMGFGAAIAVFCACLVSLLVMPLLVLWWPKFFLWSTQKEFTRGRISMIDRVYRFVRRLDSSDPGFWTVWSAQMATKRVGFCVVPLTLVVLVLTLSTLSSLTIGADARLTTPLDSQVELGLQGLGTYFNQGLATPLNVVFKMEEGPFYNKKNFEAISQFLRQVDTELLNPSDVLGVVSLMYTRDAPVEWYQATVFQAVQGDIEAEDKDNTRCNILLAPFIWDARERQFRCEGIRRIMELTTAEDSTWVTAIVLKNENLFSQKALGFIRDLRAFLQDRGQPLRDLGIQVYFASRTSATVVDLLDMLMGSFARLALPVTLLVLALIGVFFQSVLIPLRSLLTLTLSVSVGYSAMYWVYQRNVLAFLNFRGFHSPEGVQEIHFVPLVFCFYLNLGLGMDYDVFILSRIVHCQERLGPGASARQAIKKGLAESGDVITAAGIIMFLAFSSFMFSVITQSNQMGLAVSVTLLFDTFINRAIITPAIMTLFGRYNYWPGRLFYEAT